MKRAVAIKVPPPRKSAASMWQRFETEVEVTASLSHQNIIRAYDAGEHHGLPYLVTELVHGLDLHDLVARENS